MGKEASEVRLKLVALERRHPPRKRVLLSGVVANVNGENAIDCTIRDINVRGAQVQLPTTLQLGDEVYLLNTRNEIAHLAKVAWINGDLTGLSFIRSYSLEVTMPPQLAFLGRLLIEAKLRQVLALTKLGVPVEDATRVVGVTEDYLERSGMRGLFDEKVALLLHQAKRLFSK
jgi:hypothetical protein